LAVGQGEGRGGHMAGGGRHVRSQAERVGLIDPGVIASLSAAVGLDVLELRSGELVERPAFGAVLAGRGRSVEPLALAAIELAEMAARQRRPENAVAADVAAARPVARKRRLEDFREGPGRRGPA